jgi:hypothetical protein
MSKLTVTTLAGATSGAAANTVKIETGHTLESENVRVKNGIVLDNEDTTLAGGEVLGKIEFKDNDGGSASAGITSKMESLAIGPDGASALTFHTSTASSGARAALTERFRIQHDGGVTFNGDTAAANALDDYEEGTWNPTIHDLGGNNATMATQNGKYVKVGSLVLANYNLAISSKGSMTGNYLFIGGLPFSHSGSNAGSAMVNRFTNLAITISSMGMELGGGSTTSAWWTMVAGTGSTADGYLAPSNINANFFSSGTLMYTVL